MSLNSKKFYITTTLPYVNAEPHLGHALEFVRADVIARYKKSLGLDVYFNTGTDEHGTKIQEGAKNEAISEQDYVDKNATRFRELFPKLGITDEIHHIRTTDEKHIVAAKEMWKRCYDNGYIYKKAYQTKYCVGCELTKTDSELENGKCPLHLTREIELIDEENYFFKFSAFQKPLLDFYNSHPDFVIPDFRFNEIKSFVERGLEDFSISRLKSKMSWGVPVPGDDEHVMYVWFDALTSYISTLGWPDENGDFMYWKEGEPVQYCGKDNLRQQSAMWQAMLMASGLPNTCHIVIDGFITAPDGSKMSKSSGNVISPLDILDAFKDVTEYPEDVLRFVLLHDISSFEDGGMSLETIKTSYTAHLQNGIGNLTNRIMKLAVSNLEGVHVDLTESVYSDKNFNTFDSMKAIHAVMKEVQDLDQHIQKTEPFKVIKVDVETGKVLIRENVEQLFIIASHLKVFLPRTSLKIIECIRENKMPEKALFGRLL